MKGSVAAPWVLADTSLVDLRRPLFICLLFKPAGQ